MLLDPFRELELETLFISDSSAEVVTASIEIVTVPPSDDEPEELEADVPTLTVAEVSESSGDEERDELDKMEAEQRKSLQGDDRVVNEEVPSLEEDGDEEDEFTRMWKKLGLQSDQGQVNLVKENRQKVRDRMEVIWQELLLVIVEAFEKHFVTNMSLIMEQRLELLQLLAMEVEFQFPNKLRISFSLSSLFSSSKDIYLSICSYAFLYLLEEAVL